MTDIRRLFFRRLNLFIRSGNIIEHHLFFFSFLATNQFFKNKNTNSTQVTASYESHEIIFRNLY